MIIVRKVKCWYSYKHYYSDETKQLRADFACHKNTPFICSVAYFVARSGIIVKCSILTLPSLTEEAITDTKCLTGHYRYQHRTLEYSICKNLPQIKSGTFQILNTFSDLAKSAGKHLQQMGSVAPTTDYL